jgi:hypothetical protein
MRQYSIFNPYPQAFVRLHVGVVLTTHLSPFPQTSLSREKEITAPSKRLDAPDWPEQLSTTSRTSIQEPHCLIRPVNPTSSTIIHTGSIVVIVTVQSVSASQIKSFPVIRVFYKSEPRSTSAGRDFTYQYGIEVLTAQINSTAQW